MQNIHVTRYEDPAAVGYQGCISSEDRSWLLFIELDGKPSLFLSVGSAVEGGKVVHDYRAAAEVARA